MGYTTDQLVTAVRDEFGEDTASSSAVSDTQIIQFLNQAQREMCWRGNILLTCATTTTVLGQEEYPLPTDYLRAACVFIFRATGVKRQLKPVSIQSRNPLKTQSTDQRCYYIWGLNSGGLNKYALGLQDIPSENGPSDDLEIFYRQAPLTMASGGTNPEVPDHWQDGLIQGALVRIYSRMCTSDTKWLPMLDRKMANWQRWLDESKRYVNPLTLDQPIQIRDTMNYLVEDRMVF